MPESEINVMIPLARAILAVFEEWNWKTVAEIPPAVRQEAALFLRAFARDLDPPPNELCARCGMTWHSHYDPELLKFKNGPFGTFGLIADHAPYIPRIHAERG